MNTATATTSRLVGVVAAALGLAFSPLVFACGACDEDSIAATYDNAVVERAARSHDLLVYCQLSGRVSRQSVLLAARRVPGVRAQSIRISEQPGALSFAIDPRLQSARTAVAAAQIGLPPGTQLRILKVTTNSGS